MEELLYALLLSSANDAATAIALEVGGVIDSFAVMMNEKAEQIGLCDTHFTNPHGLDDEEHYTSAYDLAVLSAHALENGISGGLFQPTVRLSARAKALRHLLNHNRLLKLYDDALGVKTGYTKTSGRCLVSAAERDGVRLVAVTLSDPDDWKDHTRLLDYGFNCYSSVKLCGEGEITRHFPARAATPTWLPFARAKRLRCRFRTVTEKSPAGSMLRTCFLRLSTRVMRSVKPCSYVTGEKSRELRSMRKIHLFLLRKRAFLKGCWSCTDNG